MPLPFDLRISVRGRGVRRTSCREKQSRPCSRVLLLACLALAAIDISCSVAGSGPAPAPPQASVDVQPNPARVFIGETKHFTANVQNASNSTVNWTIQSSSGTNQGLGTIDASGNYVAPAALPSPETISVIASLQSDATVSGAATVTLQGSLTISPVRASVTTSPAASQALSLSVVTQGVGPADVGWSDVPEVGSAMGTIAATAAGASFTPPSTPGVHTLKASLNANPGVIGQATVYVTDFPGTFTWRNDNARSGINNQEWALSPSTVNSSTFGKLFSCPVDGYIYAQPLYVANLPIPGNGTHNVIFVATENDSAYAFDADSPSCNQVWQSSAQPAHLVPAGRQPILSANLFGTFAIPVDRPPAISPVIGITGTPAIDGPTGTSALYVVAATQGVSSGSNFSHYLYALDLATGQPKIEPNGRPFDSPGQPPVLVSRFENQRAALLLDNGKLYIAFGSYDAPGDYFGLLFECDATSLQDVGSGFSVTKFPSGGGIWQSGGGPSADKNDISHRVFVATGDGPPNQDANYSDSVVLLNTQGGLSVHDYFTPCDQQTGWLGDPDAALKSMSSAPLILPDAPAQPHSLIVASKNGSIYVLNRDSMGHFNAAGCPDSSGVVQAISVPGANPILSTPLYWNNCIYVAPGQNSRLVSLSVPQGALPCEVASSSHEMLGPQGATSALSWNGTSGAVLWLIDTSGAFASNGNGPAILRAYDPNDLSNELYDSTQAPKNRDQAGPAVKFTVPTVANGKVYVGTQTELDVYGLLP